MLLQQRDRVGRAAEIRVAGVEQQEYLRRVGERHQPVDVVGRLDVRAHVVMVGKLDAVRVEQVRAERVEARRVASPGCVVDEARALRDRRVDVALDRARAFAVHDDLHVVVLQLRRVRAAALDLGGDRVGVAHARLDLGEEARIPARHAHGSNSASFAFSSARLRKLVAGFEARVADFGAFLQRRFERRLAAERRQVVVHPRRGLIPMRTFQLMTCFLGSGCCSRGGCVAVRAISVAAGSSHRDTRGALHRRRRARILAAPRLPTMRRRRRSCAGAWCRSRAPFFAARRVSSRCAARRCRARTASAPIARACIAKSIVERSPPSGTQSSSMLLKRAAAIQLQPLDAAVAAVVEDHDDELAVEHHRRREFRVEHHVRAVADDHDHLRSGRASFAPRPPATS